MGKYEVEVETLEQAQIQYTALVEADSKIDAIIKVKDTIKKEGSAFNSFECIETRVIDTEAIHEENERVEWEVGDDPSWVCREHELEKPAHIPRVAIFVSNTGIQVFSEADMDVFITHSSSDRYEGEIEGVEMDTSMSIRGVSTWTPTDT